MITNLQHHYMLKDIPDTFKRFNTLVDNTNILTLNHLKSAKKDVLPNVGSLDESLLILLILLLFTDQ